MTEENNSIDREGSGIGPTFYSTRKIAVAKQDERWCANGEGRIGEYGVIGAEQADESHFDDRSTVDEENDRESGNDDEDDEDDGEDDDEYNADARLNVSDRSAISNHAKYRGSSGGRGSSSSKNNIATKTKKKVRDSISAGQLSATGRIKFSKRKSYGREDEIRSLLDAYRSNCDYLRQRRQQQQQEEEQHRKKKLERLSKQEQSHKLIAGSSEKEKLNTAKSTTARNSRNNIQKKIDDPLEQSDGSSDDDGGDGGSGRLGDSSSDLSSSGRAPCTTFISGFSGCGKSTLVDEFVRRLRHDEDGPVTVQAAVGDDDDNDSDYGSNRVRRRSSCCCRLLFLRAKYSQQRRAGKGRASITTNPFGALGGLFDHIKDEQTVQELKRQFATTTFKDEIEPDDAKVLSRIFPGLNNFLNMPECTSSGSISGSFTGGASGPFTIASPGLSSENESDHRSVSGCSDITTLRSSSYKLNKAQVEHVLQHFFELLSSDLACPLILFLDDLQWADKQSLSFLTKLLTNLKLPGLFFIGAYRSNEVNSEHSLIKAIGDIEKQKECGREETPLLRIDLKELTMEDIGQFIADTLRLDPDQVEPLTQAVYTKTLGNPFFTRQALEELVRKNVLYYDTISFQWNWNLSSQQELEKIMSDDIEEMVKNKLENLSTELQQVLVVASCITHSGTFDVDTLLEVLHAAKLPTVSDDPSIKPRLRIHLTRIDLEKLLNDGVSEGLLLKLSKTGKEIYSFSHDRIEDAAHNFMNEICYNDDNEFQMLLFKIGTSLYHRAQSAHGEDWMYFSAAHRLNSIRSNASSSVEKGDRGSSLFVSFSRQQEIELVELNRRTAELSLDLLAFNAAAEFCQFGVQDLLAGHESDAVIWETHYDLILSLYTIGAESEYSTGNIDEALCYCEKILKHKPRSIYDFLPAYKVKLDSLGGKEKGSDEIFQLSFWLCAQLGYKFPQSKTLQKIAAWAALRNVRARYIPTEESTNAMTFVEDPILIETFNMLMTAGSIAFQVTNVYLYFLVACEGLKWMSKHGLTDGSAAAISSFANALMHVYGDFETSTRLADLSVQLTDRSKKKFNASRPLNTSGMFVFGWVRPIRSSLSLHVRAQESALTSGNIEGVGVSKSWISWNMMLSAMPLSRLEAFCRKSVPQLRSMDLMFDSCVVSMTWQTALNLLGKADDATVVTGVAMDESAEPYCNLPLSRVVGAWKRYLYVIFGKWEAGAMDALETGDAFESDTVRGLMYGLETFIRGMLLIGMARKCKENKYRKPALQILQRLKEWVRKGCFNLIGPINLLKAEMYALNSNPKTQAKFDQAISLFKEAKFHQFAGLGHERLATFLNEEGQYASARQHIIHAIECYRRWGATGKVDALKMQLKQSDLKSSKQSDGEEAAPV
jgi:predicted ATPase